MSQQNTQQKIDFHIQRIKDLEFEVDMLKGFISWHKYKIRELEGKTKKGRTMEDGE